MKFDKAKQVFKAFHIDLFHDKELNLFMFIMNDQIAYVSPPDFEELDEPALKVHVATKLLQLAAENPTITLH